jgi:hypothetical protein
MTQNFFGRLYRDHPVYNQIIDQSIIRVVWKYHLLTPFGMINEIHTRITRYTKAIFIYQAMTLTKDCVLWNGLPQSGKIASPTFSEKIRNPLNLSLYLHLSNMSDLILQFKMVQKCVIAYIVFSNVKSENDISIT